MRYLLLGLAAMLSLLNCSTLAEETAYIVDTKSVPNDTYLKVGNIGEATRVGKKTSDKAIRTLITFGEKDLLLATLHAELVAQLAKHNAKRLDSFFNNSEVHEYTPDASSARLVTISVASVKDLEGTDGTKITRIEVKTMLEFRNSQCLTKARLGGSEVWEFDGKTLKLVSDPRDWSYLQL